MNSVALVPNWKRPRIAPEGTGLLIAEAMRIIPHVDGKRMRLAKVLGTNPANIAVWMHGSPVDPRVCVAIEALTGGRVRAASLRPDVFPAEGNVFPLHFNAHKGHRFSSLNPTLEEIQKIKTIRWEHM